MNILITGSNGFIGSNIIKLLSNNVNYKLFKGNRDSIDLYSIDSIERYIDKNQINTVIHCAIHGGNRLEQDTYETFYRNVLMYENLIKFNHRYKMFINFGSGAEFDRTQNISNVNEYEMFNKIPTDFYGLSKNVVTKLSVHCNMMLNLRIFGCFYYNELPTRFINNNINNYMNKKSIIIHQDRYMDFLYMEDLIDTIEYFLRNAVTSYTDINMSYLKKYKLSDIANIINELSSHKVDINIKNKTVGSNYTGNGKKLNSLGLNLKGLEFGIKECYERIKYNFLH
jgi:GDP-L-fucose synthase